MRRFVTTDHFYMPTSAHDTGWEEPLLAVARGLSGGSLEIGVHPGFEEPWRSDERETVQRLAPAALRRGPPARAVDGGRMSAASRIVVARSFEELEPLRLRLGAAAGPPLRHRPGRVPLDPRWQGAVRPHAIALERDGEVRTLVLARVEDIRLTTKVGYAAVYKPKVRALTVVYRGVLGELTTRTRELVLGELRRELATGDADVLRLRASKSGRRCTAPPECDPARLRERSAPAHRPLGARRPRLLRRVPRSLSRSTRESAKRYPRKLEKEFGDRLSLEVFRDVADSERVFERSRPRRRKTYQQGLGVPSRRPSCSGG